jgi:hypothetical protein
MSQTQTEELVPVKRARKPRKSKKVELKGSIASGILFIGDCQFFAGSPELELNAATGQVTDITPEDKLNPFNTIDRTLNLVGDTEANVELMPYLPGRGVLINTHLQQGSYVIKKKYKGGKIVSITVTIKE